MGIERRPGRGEGEVQRVQLADGQASGIYLLLLRRRPAYTFLLLREMGGGGKKRNRVCGESAFPYGCTVVRYESLPRVFSSFSLSLWSLFCVCLLRMLDTMCGRPQQAAVREGDILSLLSLPKSEGATPNHMSSRGIYFLLGSASAAFFLSCRVKKRRF